jgi:ABC-type Fe3+/spermidine/putrescine transport system ATPase subunit
MIHTEQLSFNIDSFKLKRINLKVSKGEYFALLGPPGSGKSIFLECLCGLKQADSGRIFIDESDVTDFAPRRRGIGYVPQDYALFPHLCVEANIAFGLKTKSKNRKQIASKVHQAAEMLHITDLLGRNTYGLSGGEKQRVALARAIVMEPKVLLLDEPVCALDEATRQKVCSMLRRIQRQLQLTTIHVSHNLEEAFSVADRAAILHQGKLMQTGPLDELLRKPDNEFVARFMRCENIFCGEVIAPGRQAGQTRVKVGQVELTIPGDHRGTVKFMIRPENVLICPCGSLGDNGRNILNLELAGWRDYGSYIKAQLDGSIDLVAHLPHPVFVKLKAEKNSPLTATLNIADIHILGQ